MVVFENIDLFLKNSKDKNINFCVSNNKVINIVKNLIISCKNNNIKIILFALDNIIVDNLKNDCDIVKYYNHNLKDKILINKIDPNKNYLFGTEEFKYVVNQRFFISNEILKYNKYSTYLDIDLVVLKNFENNILKQFKENPNIDCLMQHQWDNQLCTGFFSMKPTSNNLKLNHDFFVNNKYWRYKHDQDFFNNVIKNNKIINVKALEDDLYVHGHNYYNNSTYYDDKCFIIHFNCIKGEKNKINQMKKFKKWYL